MRRSGTGLSRLRQRTEDYQRASLSSWATLATDSKGREHPEEPDPLRTAFQLDRDRILASDAFRRLADKSHAFLPDPDRLGAVRDRSRQHHALEVAVVARTIARALALNEDLVEAIALARDLGAPAFASAGEEALGIFTDEPFRHHEQSRRVVESLEADGAGLNLTWEVRDGILHHTWTMPPPATPEGQAVRVAGRGVGVLRDLDEGVRLGLLPAQVVPPQVLELLGPNHEARVQALVEDAVRAGLDRPEVRSTPPVEDALATLAALVEARVHARPAACAQRDRAVHVLRSLAAYGLEHPDALPAAHPDDPLEVRVLDEVSGMTDSRALALFVRRFVPDGVSH